MSEAKLKTYRSMRDFTRTAEPSGERTVAQASRLRFVIQKHAATRLHYDLRLELDGVFKSWAVTRGPSLDPADKRLAVEVEDHPLDYGDFEGTIPKGEYGGGTVLMWDRGFWAPEPGVDPQRALKKGELKFVMAGERVKGGFVLVRLRRREREKRDNWLLIKHRDQYAREGGGDITDTETSIASGREMDAITAGKGRKPRPFMLRSPEAADAVWRSNRGEKIPAKPGRKAAAARTKAVARTGALRKMPAFIEPQLCELRDRAPAGAGWGHEVKFDGYRMQIRVEKHKAQVRTRKGLDWTSRFQATAKAARTLPDCIIDGELVALDKAGAPSFAALQAAISSKETTELTFFAFDLLCLGKEDLRSLPLSMRKEKLSELIAGLEPAIRYTSHLESAGDAVLKAACQIDLEGVVSKKLDAPYQSGRSETWIKSKCRAGQEVVIGGWTQERGRFRSLLVGVHREGKLTYVGKVGTGFGHEVVERIFPKLKAVAASTSPFEAGDPPRAGAGIRWAEPSLVAEIEFAGWTGDGHVRQGAFKGLREDKSAAAIIREEPKTGKATPSPIIRTPGGAKVLGVGISNADKPLWPEASEKSPVTKMDLVTYYEQVGAWMLEHIKGRPCSIVRMPDGIGGETFFQRHVNRTTSNLFTAVTVSGDKQPYIQIDRIEALIAAGQIAALELHPWNCQPFDPETPGRLVFDLDPAPDVPFERVIEGAKEFRDRLAALGLESFCKTTGGKGLHVVTPFKVSRTDLRWPEAKGFAQEVCRQMAADSPDRYLINMAKKERVGRIFLDYLRNDRTATAVAPLSPRGRPMAPVSMPIAWTQVRKGLDPMRYSIFSVPQILKRARPWEGYCEGERPFHPAARKLLAGRS
ncbi:MAG: DNA ligase D [Alphaproteobacteria bacterium]|nr:MAG: DNA ligase D [Alphaproteobacteria bacterium]